jgi:centromere/kinetochore protein ZW10
MRLTSHLQSEIRQISSDSAPDVDTWITNAKSLQDNVEKSRKLANSIIREAEADEERLERVQENENYVDFLAKETAFNDQLLEALRSIQRAHDSLDKAEELASERKILEALRLLEGWAHDISDYVIAVAYNWQILGQ